MRFGCISGSEPADGRGHGGKRIARRAPVHGDSRLPGEGIVAIAGNKHRLPRAAEWDGFS